MGAASRYDSGTNLRAEVPAYSSKRKIVPLENYPDFTRAIHQMRGVRLRDGAMRWGIFRDAMNPEILSETFIMESWLDYLRSRERITTADAAIRDSVRALHRSDTPPVTTHQIYAKEITASKPAASDPNPG